MNKRIYIQGNQITLNSVLDGHEKGTPIVFINSLGSDLRSWDHVVTELTRVGALETHQIVRYDKRGHGLSDCPPPPYSLRDHTMDLAALVDSLVLEKVILVGISIGGMIAMDYAAQHPNKIEALVLCDTAPKIGTADGWNERILKLRKNGMAHLADPILSRWFAPDFIQQSPAAYSIYRNMLMRTPLDGYTGSCEAIRDADLTSVLAQITAPTLVLCGAEDLATSPKDCQLLSESLAHSQFEIIPGAGTLTLY